MTTFIHLPSKKTDEIDWESPLTKFLTETFGRSFTDDIVPSIAQLNKLRTDIQHAPLSESATILPTYLNYIIQLDSINLRLPMDIVIQTGDLEFSWSDAFDTSSAYSFKSNSLVKQASLSFEKSSVMFQLASVHSYLACVASSSMDWKSAVQHFTHAAGVLDFISLHFLHAPTNDLKVDTTKALSKLMIAQAQECFLWNYMQSPNVKHSLCSKLAEGTSASYITASELLGKSKAKLDCDWDVKLKGSYFHTFAMHHNAQAYMEATKVGYALVANELARDGFSECRRISGQLGKYKIDPGLSQLIGEIEKEITAKHDEWEKDNDLIYNQPLPAKNNIPNIKGMEGAKLVDLDTQLKNSGFRDLFEKIVPMEAHQGMSVYSEKQAEISREWDDKVQIANEKVKSVFEFTKVPDLIIEIQNLLRPTNAVIEEEEREKDDQYPRILAMAHDVESSLSNSDFEKSSAYVKSKKEAISKNLEETDSLLLKDDRNKIVKGIPNDEFLEKAKDDILSIRRNLAEADMSDSKLINLWRKYSTEVNVLKNGSAGVQKWLVPSSGESDLVQQVSLLDLDDRSDEKDLKTAQHMIDKIHQLKKSLDLLVNERNSTLSDLKSAMHSEDISSILIKFSGVSDEELGKVFDDQLSKYNDYLARLARLISAQEDKILQLKDLLNQLLDLSIVKKKLEERKKQRGTVKNKLLRLADAYESWKLCTKGIEEASAFYTKLGAKTSEMYAVVWERVQNRGRETDNIRGSVSSFNTGFGGHTVNSYQSSVPPPPSYSSTSTYFQNPTSSMPTGAGFGPPPVPSKPSHTGTQNNSDPNMPYSTPSVYSPGMYNQFGQNWQS